MRRATTAWQRSGPARRARDHAAAQCGILGGQQRGFQGDHRGARAAAEQRHRCATGFRRHARGPARGAPGCGGCRAHAWSMPTARAELSFGRMISPLAELKQKGLMALHAPRIRSGHTRGRPRDAEGAIRRLGQRRLPSRPPRRRRGSRPPRRAVLPLHRGRGLLRVRASDGMADPVHPRGRDRPPARPVARYGSGCHERRLPPEPPCVLRQAPPKVDAVATCLPTRAESTAAR